MFTCLFISFITKLCDIQGMAFRIEQGTGMPENFLKMLLFVQSYQCRGERPSSSMIFTRHLCLMSTSTTFNCPPSHAENNGVCLRLSNDSMCAP